MKYWFNGFKPDSRESPDPPTGEEDLHRMAGLPKIEAPARSFQKAGDRKPFYLRKISLSDD